MQRDRLRLHGSLSHSFFILFRMRICEAHDGEPDHEIFNIVHKREMDIGAEIIFEEESV